MDPNLLPSPEHGLTSLQTWSEKSSEPAERRASRAESIELARSEADRGADPSAEGPELEIDLWRLTPNPPPSEMDLATARIVLDENFLPVSDPTWYAVKSMIRDEGWTAEQLRTAVHHVLRTKTWIATGDAKPRWQIGDLFRVASPKVYGYSWYARQVSPPTGSPANDRAIGRYRVPGYEKPLFGWRREVGSSLPDFFPPEQNPEPETVDEIDDRTERIDQVSRQLMKMQREVCDRDEVIDRLKRELRVYRDAAPLEWRQKYEAVQLERLSERDAIKTLKRECNELIVKLLTDPIYYEREQRDYLTHRPARNGRH